MAKAVFIAPHTFGYATGIILVAAGSFFLPHHRPTQEADAIVIMALLIMFFALMQAALFSLGCAWGGVPSLPKPGWALVTGIVTGAGYVAHVALMDAIPAPMDPQSHKQLDLYRILGTAYIFMAPIIAGLLCAWIAKRAR